ncbi:MAG: adenine phosphoribosyltransferase [Flavobacteriales bacterium]|nr:adenine phosphoribosyltransferase [Flavobacteriales bacterium]MCX7649385.1 adenine phosphoribosyltransferase [Flavobacteriales bacterium]MDW8432742.1 adenine phosphoribosyltransferase [Flavobacteriales bacterium]
MWNFNVSTLAQRLAERLRVIPDFPSPGVRFRDLTPVLQDPPLCGAILDWMEEISRPAEIHAVAGIESRGFFFGFALAQRLGVPFVPLRKGGKLPAETYTVTYDLEYGSAVLEMHKDAVAPGMRVLIHDDLLATGGTLAAACRLVEMASAVPALLLVLTDLGLRNAESKVFLSKYEISKLLTVNNI